MKEIISSLDIGSSTIKLVVGEVYNNEVNVLSVSEVKSKGVKKGIIVNPEETLVSLKEAFNRTEEMLSIKINKVVLLVPSYYAEFIITEGSVNVRNEKYYYFDIFNLANKEYAKKAVQTEFESFCTDNHLTLNAYEGRYT